MFTQNLELLKEYDEIVREMAYPSSFNMEEFQSIKSYRGKTEYAAKHLQKLASGSSRVVYKIDEEKVLKLAKNEKGLAQNDTETDGYFHHTDVTAKVFEYDQKHDKPYWLEMELAKKVKPTEFKKILGFSHNDLCAYLSRYGMFDRSKTLSTEVFDSMHESEWVNELVDMAICMDMGMPGDFGRLSTYGIVNRDGDLKVVVIDFGLTEEVFKTHYRIK